MFDEYYECVKPAVLAVAPRYAAYGYDTADCLQEAALCILGLIGSHAEADAGQSQAYVKRCVMNHLESLARRHDAFDSSAAAPEPEDGRTDLIVWNDLLRSAPKDIGDYLKARVVDKLSWDAAKARLGETTRGLNTLREDTATWLLHQYEGRKYNG